MTKMCWFWGCLSFTTGPCQRSRPLAESSPWWQVMVFTEVYARSFLVTEDLFYSYTFTSFIGYMTQIQDNAKTRRAVSTPTFSATPYVLCYGSKC